VFGESEIGPIRGPVGGVPEFVLINRLTRSLHKSYIHEWVDLIPNLPTQFHIEETLHYYGQRYFPPFCKRRIHRVAPVSISRSLPVQKPQNHAKWEIFIC